MLVPSLPQQREWLRCSHGRQLQAEANLPPPILKPLRSETRTRAMQQVALHSIHLPFQFPNLARCASVRTIDCSVVAALPIYSSFISCSAGVALGVAGCDIREAERPKLGVVAATLYPR